MSQSVKTTLTDLAESPQLRASTHRLIEKIFPTGSESSTTASLDCEFCLLLDEKNAKRVLVLNSEKGPLASASYRVFDVRVPGSPSSLRVAGVGLVVTDSEARGHGYARQLQLEIEKRATAEGCVLSVLWSDLADFYSKMGYIVAGTELQWHLEEEEIGLLGDRLAFETPSPSAFEVRPLESLNWIQPLYDQLGFGPERSFRDYAPLLTLPETGGLGAWKGERLRGYLLYGKARDLRHTVHELVAEDRAAVPALLQAVLPRLPKQLRVHLPMGSLLESEISHWLGTAEKSGLAFFKILNPTAFTAWITQSKRLPSGVRAFAEGSHLFLSRDGPKGPEVFFETDDPAHLAQLFLGPWRVDELEGLPPLLKDKLAGTIPAPVYFWGFDSV